MSDNLLDQNLQESRRVAANQPSSSSSEFERFCLVCSDRASGFNFGVLTCESCKAFFRRNAARKTEVKCPFSNSCQITIATRKYCQACRLQKCFNVGMNSDCLLDLKSKNQRKSTHKRRPSDFLMEDVETEEVEDPDRISVSKKFLQKLLKQAKKKDCCTCICSCGFYPPGTRLIASSSFSMRNSTMSTPATSPREMESSSSSISPYPSPQIGVPTAASKPTQSATYSQPIAYSPTINPFQSPMYSSWNSPATFQFRPVYESSAFHTVVSPMDSVIINQKVITENKKIAKYSTILTQEEYEMLEELHNLNEPLNRPLEKNYNSDSLQGIIRIVEEALRRIISMASNLKSFRELDIEDRKQLVKSGFCELLIVRGIMAYNKTNNSWNHNFATEQMEVKIDILKKEPGAMEHYEMHKKLLESFSDEIRTNENIMLIFNAIVIFHPRVSNLKDSKKVHATQAKYFALLLKVLTFEFSEEKANISYKNLLDLVVDLHRVNQTMLHIFYGLDPTQLDPLVRELCNFT